MQSLSSQGLPDRHMVPHAKAGLPHTLGHAHHHLRPQRHQPPANLSTPVADVLDAYVKLARSATKRSILLAFTD